MCGVPSGSEDEIVKRKITRKQANQGIRLDRLMIHYKGKHREAFLAEGRSLLDLRFTTARDVEAVAGVEADDIPSEADMETLRGTCGSPDRVAFSKTSNNTIYAY